MPRPGVSRADIQRAKSALIAQGGNPSANNIRAYLGTGSKTTIVNLLAELEGNETAPIEDPPESLPRDLHEAMSAAAAGWYERARAALKDRAEAARCRLKDEMSQLGEIRAESMAAQARTDELEDELIQTRGELVAAKAGATILRDELRKAQQELATAYGIIASERMRIEVAVADAKEARRQAGEELNLRIALERDKAALQEAAKMSGKRL